MTDPYVTILREFVQAHPDRSAFSTLDIWAAVTAAGKPIHKRSIINAMTSLGFRYRQSNRKPNATEPRLSAWWRENCFLDVMSRSEYKPIFPRSKQGVLSLPPAPSNAANTPNVGDVRRIVVNGSSVVLVVNKIDGGQVSAWMMVDDSAPRHVDDIIWSMACEIHGRSGGAA